MLSNNPIASSAIAGAASLAVNPLSASINAVATGLASTLIVDKHLSGIANVDVTTTALAVANNPVSASVSAVVIVAPLLHVDKNLNGDLAVNAFATATIDLANNLSANANVVASGTGAPVIDNKLQSNVIFNAITATILNADKLLSSSITLASAVADATLNVTRNLSANVNVTSTVNAVPEYGTEIWSSVNVSANATADLIVLKPVATDANVIVTTDATIHIEHRLSASVNITAQAIVSYTQSSVIVSVTADALLDIDGNTAYSPGGLPVDGFSPLSSITFIRHSETDDQASYYITADFSEDPDIETEIIEVDFDDNPAEVLSYSFIDNVATINVLTPKQVYAESSTFLITKEVIPIYGTKIDYNTKYSSKIKQSRVGNNFYSSKFFIPGNYLCSLMDDGYGNINMYEWIDATTSVIVSKVGTINYDNGLVEIKGLSIIGIDGTRMFFYAESLDSIVPTSDYLNLKSSELVQSTTIVFPSGEKVAVSQYEKSTTKVIVWAYVKARSYNVNSPETTIETREVLYKIVIEPDYNVGRDKLVQAVAEQT